MTMLPDPLHQAIPAIVRRSADPVLRLAPERDAVDALRYATADLSALDYDKARRGGR